MTAGVEGHPAIARAAGWALAFLGAVVIAGWFAHLPALVQLQPNWASMKLNTAVCFALFGAATLAVTQGRHRTALVCCLVVAAIAVATESQYVFGVDLRVDELLLPAFLVEPNVPPGRMSPITAALFMIAAAGLGSLMGQPSTARSTVAAFGASIIAGVALDRKSVV